MLGDLHCHTLYSDGKLTPKDVIKRAESKGIDYLAITDHDCVIGSEMAYYQTKHLTIIFGLELTTVNNAEDVHILGYFPKPLEKGSLLSFLTRMQTERKKRAYRILKLLQLNYGVKLNSAFIAKRHLVTRGTILQEILAQCDIDRNTAYQMLAKDGKAYVPMLAIATEAGIKMIHENHGLAVIAHPCLLKKNKLEDFFKMGLDGIEGRYKSPLNDEAKYRRICTEKNLLFLAGSDFHFVGDPHHGDIGEMTISGDDLDKFLEALDAKRQKFGSLRDS